jgi:hypothetical protein
MSATFEEQQKNFLEKHFNFCGINVDLSKLHEINLLYGHGYEPKVLLSYKLSDNSDKLIHTEIKPALGMEIVKFLDSAHKLIRAFEYYETKYKKDTTQNLSATDLLDKLVKQSERLDKLDADYVTLSNCVDVVRRETENCETRLDQLVEFREEFHAEFKAATQMVLAAKEMIEHNNKVVNATRSDCDKMVARSETMFNNITDLIVAKGNDSASNITALNNTLRKYVDDKVFGIYCAGAIAGVAILAALFAVLHFASK